MLGRLSRFFTSMPSANLQNQHGSAALTQSGAQPDLAVFAAGCFWGVEHIFLKHYPIAENKGILSTAVGYTGGRAAKVNYTQVCSGETGHAEALKIEFDPEVVSYKELVNFFFCTHDPTTEDRQGNDFGSQYRSAIFYVDDKQKSIAEEVRDEVQKEHFTPIGKTICTTLEPFKKDGWFNAEDYHQEYLHKNPGGYQCSTHRLHWEMK
ncbi:Peptide-methionine (S)-S-oxide reductase [Steccherinum ochraceum]|uniref:peptide-methionine (S)-S-oxide reductase n=1 Tax=Steccherinum ochraceum TaxID=92696 RepID=A0A4R0RX35_9APHY|nr:Peptide-methionine (S)-S-oxide reductase [Steccherinum ochraceum]